MWDVVEDKQGNLFVATGDEGKIFKVGADGKAAVVYASSADSQVLCLCTGSDGTIYAGTGPRGKIIKLAGDGKGEVFAEGLDSYVWSIVYDPATQALFAGTGPKGKIYQLTAAGKSTVHYATRQDHILSLARGKNGLYAGTDKGGLVYRIDAKDKGFVLYQAAQGEVRSLLVTDAAFYAGTSSPNLKRPPVGGTFRPGSGGTSPMGNPSFSPASKKASAEKESDEPETAQAGSTSPGSIANEPSKGTPASAPSNPVVGDNSLYRIASDGTVRTKCSATSC